MYIYIYIYIYSVLCIRTSIVTTFAAEADDNYKHITSKMRNFFNAFYIQDMHAWRPGAKRVTQTYLAKRSLVRFRRGDRLAFGFPSYSCNIADVKQ
jgi:hypothetical protein